MVISPLTNTTNIGYVCPGGEVCDLDQAQTGVNNTYGYDANGNQTTRTIGGVTSTLGYDADREACRRQGSARRGSPDPAAP